MEGDKLFRAQIERNVRQRAKFKLLDSVKVKGKNITGFVHTIVSTTDIKDTNSTKVQYLIRADGEDEREKRVLLGFYAEELELYTTPEKVNFD